jgi:L-fuculose-phosphate aldolase
MEIAGDPRVDIVRVMSLLYQRGLINIMGGNASIIDRDRNIVYISPSAVPKNLLRPEDVAVIDIDGRVVRGTPSSEYRLHLEVYKRIGNTRAILHAHLPHAILAGELGLKLEPQKYIESKYTVGKCVATVERLPSGTRELAEATARTLYESGCKAAILLGHGAVAYSNKTLYHALDTLEGLEFLSYIELMKKSHERS